MSTSLTRELTKCPICLDTVKTPKALPCLHTFCLDCLVKYVDEESDRDELNCPICRKVFTVPNDGLVGLSTNFLVQQILQHKSGPKLDSTDGNACVICEVNSSSKYCVECGDKMCDDYSTKHLKSRGTKLHRVVTQNELNSSTVLLRSRVHYCEKHPDNQLQLYCRDCQLVICVLCHALDHRTHLCCDLEQSPTEIKDKLLKCNTSIHRCIKFYEELKLQLNCDKNYIMEQLGNVASAISNRKKELMKILESQIDDKLSRVETYKNETLKALEIRMNEVD